MSAAEAPKGTVLIVESRYYPDIADGLIAGALPLLAEVCITNVWRSRAYSKFPPPSAMRPSAANTPGSLLSAA